MVDCAPSVLQAIRALVLERFNSTPHGGTEFAGVLFGSHTSGEVQISAFRLISSGGAFTYAASLEEDERALADVMSAAHTSDELAGLELMGWFRAHPRSGLDLSRRDLEISSALFPEPWHVVLVVRPGNSAPMRARFFLHDTNGPWKAGCSFRESVLPPAAEPLFISESPGAELASVLEQAPLAEPEAGPPATPSEDVARAEKAMLAPATQQPRKHMAVAWPVALVVFAGLVGLLYWWTRPSHIGLRVSDTAGQLRITWDGTSRLVRNDRAAHLEITDGGEKLWLELAREQLRSGNVAYTRRSSNVTVRMVVQPAGGAPVEEVASVIGPVAQPPIENAQVLAPVEIGSRERSVNPPSLVVQVPVEQSAPEPVQKKFAAPPRKTAKAPTVNLPPAPELAAPPLVARQTPLVTPPVRMEPPLEKPAPASTATAPPAAASIPAQIPARAPAAVPHAPASGRVIWIGRLQKNQPVTITGKNCSTGTVIGELPARPFKFSVSPGDLSSDGIVLYTSNLQYANNVVEPPGAENGWNRTVYTWNPKYANDVSVIESPAQPNQWSRIVLRSKNPKISVIVIDWIQVN